MRLEVTVDRGPEIHLSAEAARQLAQLADTDDTVVLGCGELCFVLDTHMSDRHVVSVARQENGQLWIIFHSGERNLRQHLRQLLAHWPFDEAPDDELAALAARLAGSDEEIRGLVVEFDVNDE